MADSKSSLIKALPIGAIMLVIGGALGFLGFKNPMIAGVVGVAFFLGGTLMGLLMQLIAHTGSTAHDDIAEQIGDAIDRGFKGFSDNLVRNEESLTSLTNKLSSGVGTSVGELQSLLDGHTKAIGENLTNVSNQVSTALSSSTAGISDSLAGSTAGLSDQFGQNAQSLVDALKQHSEAMDRMGADLSDKITGSYAEGAELFKDAINKHVEQINAAGVDWHEEYRKVLEGYTESLTTSSNKLAGELKSVHEVGSNIESLIRATESIDGALKSIGAADEFKTTLLQFKEHLEKSQGLLEQAARPRRIQLVESEAE